MKEGTRMHHHLSMFSIFLICLVFSERPAAGFEKNAHEEISKKAVAIYREINPELSAKREKALHRFIEGSKDEDDISVQRIFNWHFYDAGKKLGRTWWRAERSNGARFDELENQISHPKKISLEAYYATAGRAVHHIQDMRSPAHTVPVYHLRDPFDSFGTASIKKTTLKPEILAQVLKESRSTFKTLLKHAAEQTLDTLGKPVTVQGKTIAENWNAFWLRAEQTGERCRKKPCKGFGCYGKIPFGTLISPYTQEVYQVFYDRQIESAVLDTVRVLLLLEKP